MKITPTTLDGVLIFEPTVFEDHRGFFMETYNEQKLQEFGLSIRFVQDNHSLSVETGTIRGLHYQLSPHAQTKLVRVLAGAILDIAVDIRVGSPTFGKWVGVELSAENKKQLLIPQGFAHGFCTLAPQTEVFYKVDVLYAPAHDRGIRWDDPQIGISWPTDRPVLSNKDQVQPLLCNAELDV